MIIHPLIIELFIRGQAMEEIVKTFELMNDPEAWNPVFTDRMLDVAEAYGVAHEAAIEVLGITEVNKQMSILEKEYEIVN